MKKMVYSANESIKGKDLFVHPVCALSFPNIYQLGGPGNMNLKFCSQVDIFEISKIKDSSVKCDLCDKSSARLLKCHEYDKYQKQAHAFCILYNNLELIYQNDVCQNYDYDLQVANKWTI